MRAIEIRLNYEDDYFSSIGGQVGVVLRILQDQRSADLLKIELAAGRYAKASVW